MKKQLRKPENWQDFEELCKILWGEIWNCSEIKKNGRPGQVQNGVDIYGKPSWEKAEYYGIQCKGKDDYSNATLTENEILKEIENAKKFKPELKKLYFVTTANKDAKIEEFVRLKDIENQKNGLFEIFLFCWEDIVHLIDQNRKTFNWFVRKIDFNSLYNCEVVFNNHEKDISFNPILVKTHVKYEVKQKEFISRKLPPIIDDPDENRKNRLEKVFDPQPKRFYINGETINKSSCEFYLILKNIGGEVIENYKLYFELEGEIEKSDTTNKQIKFLDTNKYTFSTRQYTDTNRFVFEPKEIVLVQNDSISTDKICFRPTEKQQLIFLNWNFVARDFNIKGKLTININPIIRENSIIEYATKKIDNEIRYENYFE